MILLCLFAPLFSFKNLEESVNVLIISLWDDNACGMQHHELAAEAFYLMAIVYDKLGRLEEREEAAMSFKKHIVAHENPQDEEDNLISMF